MRSSRWGPSGEAEWVSRCPPADDRRKRLRPHPHPDPATRVDAGRWPVKRRVGDTVDVSADVFRDGHEVLRADVRCKAPGRARLARAPAGAGRRARQGRPLGRRASRSTSSGAGSGRSRRGRRLRRLARRGERKIDAGQEDLTGEPSEGVVLLREAAERADGRRRAALTRPPRALEDARRRRARQVRSTPRSRSWSPRASTTEHGAHGPAADRRGRPRARRASAPGTSCSRARWAASRGVAEQVPRLAELGFDVLYLPPIHPIGETNRKGRNNTLDAGPDDPGSPWAIGDERRRPRRDPPGARHLRGLRRARRDAAREHGIDIALDLAINASADHPWLTEHPEWFNRRPDGTLKYAENPPKKYQDIYNFNFDSEDWRGLWRPARGRPPLGRPRRARCSASTTRTRSRSPFWEWLIDGDPLDDPDVIFLAEAFTRAR